MNGSPPGTPPGDRRTGPIERPESDSKQSLPDDIAARDQRYLQILVTAIRECAQYKPMFGQGRTGGLTLEQFRQLYGTDPFYSWIGLDSPLMYAAHKAAGGMTSIYRQIGKAIERIFRRILQDSLELSAAEAAWSYEIPTPSGATRRLSLDGRIRFVTCVIRSGASAYSAGPVSRQLNCYLSKLLVHHS